VPTGIREAVRLESGVLVRISLFSSASEEAGWGSREDVVNLLVTPSLTPQGDATGPLSAAICVFP
jgi:hypothetical protein